MKQNSIRYLCYVVLGYLVVVHTAGCLFILAYLSLFPDLAGAVIERKGIPATSFALFTTVSSFANCGFVPTNENMVVFRTCSGMLWTVAALVLLGNTVYPVGLRALLWALNKIRGTKELEFMLSDDEQLGYDHLMRRLDVVMLGMTVCGFVVVQFVLFCCLEWSNGETLVSMSAYEKVAGAVFMSVNSRHAGEAIVDLSKVSPAILVLYVVMM